MYDWEQLTKDALQDLGAESLMVPGAKLREHMVRIGSPAGFDVAGHVAKSGTSFSRLVEGVAGVIVQARPGSDVLVGLDGARIPEETAVPREAKSRYGGLRSDVYQAFTRVSKVAFAYLPGTDRFVPADQAQGASIEVEGQTLERLIAYRQEFVRTLPLEDQQRLLDALDHSTNPLSDFRREVTARGMLARWTALQEKIIKDHVIKWASKHGLTPRDAWFQRSQISNTPHRTLARLTPYLTADEIRDLRIPFRAIEALLADLQEK